MHYYAQARPFDDYHLPSINRLTTACGTYTLRIDLEDFEGDKAYAEYSTFSVADPTTDYRLTI